ncbi:glycosyltransferase family 2 protein [Photobacterium damselae subsp. damselae]
MKPISIVIITLNEQKRIGRLLFDLQMQSYQNFEVILVDSNSEDNTCQIAEQFRNKLPALTIHKMEQRGVSLGRNTGASLAKHERLLFLDADVRLDKQFLAKACKQLEQSKLEIAGVYMGAKGMSYIHALGYGVFNAGLFVTQFIFPTAVGACIFSTQRVHQEIGGFDQAISLCEDCDYVNRASKTWRYRMLNLKFRFDSRRLDQDGLFIMGYTYLKANIRRFFLGEMRNNEIPYPFGHYQQ